MPKRYALYGLMVLLGIGLGFMGGADGPPVMSDTLHVLMAIGSILAVVLLEMSYKELVRDVARQVAAEIAVKKVAAKSG